jgi:methanogenic corrinoid protein MtbC1
LKLITGLAQGVATIVEGSTAIAQGTISISMAKLEQQVGYIRASSLEISAMSQALKNQMANDQDTIKDLLQKIQDSIDAATQILRGFFETQSQISRNISQGRSV